MHRQPEHVIQFLFAELGTNGSVDGSARLVIKGRFQQSASIPLDCDVANARKSLTSSHLSFCLPLSHSSSSSTLVIFSSQQSKSRTSCAGTSSST